MVFHIIMDLSTSQSDELSKQSEEMELSGYYHPPSGNFYRVLLSQQDYVLKVQEMENNARTIRSRFQEIANLSLQTPTSSLLKKSEIVNSSPQIPASPLLRKAVVSVRKEEISFSVDQLEEVVDLIMKKFPYILFKPKAKSKDYVVVLFWASSNNAQDCCIQSEVAVVQIEIAVDQYDLRFAVENVCNPKSQFFYLLNNFNCAKVQNDDIYKVNSEEHEQLQMFVEMIQASSRKRKVDPI